MSKIKATDRDKVKEAVDIIKNVDDDEAALEFLKDTLDEDYFPDMDLGSMDLHEAVEKLDTNSKRRKMTMKQKVIADISKSLDEFMELQDKKKRQKQAQKRKRKRR